MLALQKLIADEPATPLTEERKDTRRRLQTNVTQP